MAVKNSIVAGNTGANCSGSPTSLGYNLEDTNTCGFNQTADQNNTDPQIGPLADNGGPTQTHALLAGSPAIDAGDDTVCVAPNNDTDQRGESRPVDYEGDAVGPFCDIGAFEAAFASGPIAPAAIWRPSPVQWRHRASASGRSSRVPSRPRATRQSSSALTTRAGT